MSDENKPKNCAPEFTALQNAYNTIAYDYTNLPSKLKNDGVERVELGFEETDIGSTDLTDSKRMCAFAKKLVTSVKKAQDFHKKRLRAARYLVCTKAGDLLKAKLISKLVNCLVNARRDANQGNDATAKTDIQNDIDTFNMNGLKRVSKLFRMMKDKCLMKDTETSQAARVVGVFKSKLTVHIETKAGIELTLTEMEKIATAIIAAVLEQHPNAINIVTTFKTAESTRRQLRPRRALDSTVESETTYDLDAPGPVDEDITIVLEGNFTVQATEVEIESTAATIEVTEEIQEIDAELPSGDEELADTTVAPADEYVDYANETLLEDANTTMTNATPSVGPTTARSVGSNLVGKYVFSC